MDDTINTKDLIELNHSQFIDSPEDYMLQLSNHWLALVLSTDDADFNRINSMNEAVSQIGKIEQQGFWQLNNRLKIPLEKLMRDSEGGGKTNQLLIQLQTSVLKIKPPNRSFWASYLTMFQLLFSIKDSAWEIWLEKYPVYKNKINEINEQLEVQKRQLKRDSSMLVNEKKGIDAQVQLLENSFDLILFIENKSKEVIENNKELESSTRLLLVNEFIPAIQQRIIELQQQLLIARQSVMTLDLFILQNDSQIQAIDQATHSTLTAINVTASLYVLEQTASSEKPKNHKNIKVDTKALKQARHMIDQALIKVNEIKKASIGTPNNTKHE